jgi:hypothetical protein
MEGENGGPPPPSTSAARIDERFAELCAQVTWTDGVWCDKIYPRLLAFAAADEGYAQFSHLWCLDASPRSDSVQALLLLRCLGTHLPTQRRVDSRLCCEAIRRVPRTLIVPLDGVSLLLLCTDGVSSDVPAPGSAGADALTALGEARPAEVGTPSTELQTKLIMQWAHNRFIDDASAVAVWV